MLWFWIGVISGIVIAWMSYFITYLIYHQKEKIIAKKIKLWLLAQVKGFDKETKTLTSIEFGGIFDNQELAESHRINEYDFLIPFSLNHALPDGCRIRIVLSGKEQ